MADKIDFAKVADELAEHFAIRDDIKADQTYLASQIMDAMEKAYRVGREAGEDGLRNSLRGLLGL